MKWGLTGVAVLLIALWVGKGLLNPSQQTVDRGLASIEFVVPTDYTVLSLGESTLDVAASRLLQAVETDDRVGAVFSLSGDEIQILVDVTDELIDERITGRRGTLQRVFWKGSVKNRLRWAAVHGNLEAPDMDPPKKQNPYH